MLEIQEVPTPEPRGDQMRVRVRACGLNRADLLQTRGHYPAPAGVPADIPGLEYAGEVDALGPAVTGPLKVGDRVFGIVAEEPRPSIWSPTSGWRCRSPPISTFLRRRRFPRSSSPLTTP